MKSPLRYPGGKTRAVKLLNDKISHHLDTFRVDKVCSPFFGGGSFEIHLAERGYRVYGYDVFLPLVNFWQKTLEDVDRVADRAEEYRAAFESGDARALFRSLQHQLPGMVPTYQSAAVFFVLNRASFSGSTLSGGMSPGYPRFNQGSIDRLRQFSTLNLTVEKADYRDSISRHGEDVFIYLDPPYMIDDALYGDRGSTHRNFDHEGLVSILKTRGNWCMSYNDLPEIRDLYQDFEIESVSWTYGMGANKESNEVLIYSHDFAHEPTLLFD